MSDDIAVLSADDAAPLAGPPRLHGARRPGDPVLLVARGQRPSSSGRPTGAASCSGWAEAPAISTSGT